MCDAPSPSDIDFLGGDVPQPVAAGLAGLIGPAGAGDLTGAYDAGKYDPSNVWRKITGGPSEKGGGASGLRAKIAREQWADYKQRFVPIEDMLLSKAKNPEVFKEENRGLALGRVNAAYDRAPDQIERRMNSYGLSVTPEMEERIARQLGYDRTLANVQAANVSDRLSEDQLQGIRSGGLLVGNRQATTNQRPQVGG